MIQPSGPPKSHARVGVTLQGYSRSDGGLTFRIPFHCGCVGHNGSGQRLTSVSLISAWVEPPTGIEPATPSLPWIDAQAPC